MKINDTYYRYYENPYDKIEELSQMVHTQAKHIRALEESEKFHKDKTIELAEKLGLFEKK